MSGTKNDGDKPKLHMIPEEAIYGMAQAFMFGAKKYDKWNYKKGLEYTRLTDSMQRHILAFLQGEDNDEESGMPHTWHALACVAMLEYMRVNKQDMDDRFKGEK